MISPNISSFIHYKQSNLPDVTVQAVRNYVAG